MKNSFIYSLSSKVLLSVKGKNIDNFIKRLNRNNIEILKIIYISYKEINILIKKQDYDKVLDIKTTYEIEINSYEGLEKFKLKLFSNKYIIIFILFFLIILYILSNIIFSVSIITNDSKMKEIMIEELKYYGIKKFEFKKNYLQIENIKRKMLHRHKEDIEWLEIENIGTKYIIKYEPRVKNKIRQVQKKQNIVSKYDALIKDMKIEKGDVIKDVGTYVKKGDVIVSGVIKLNEESKEIIGASGTVYGEVWYNLKIDFPYKYYNEKETGRRKSVLVLNFFNKKLEILNFKKYETKKVKEKVILKNSIFPIYLSKDYQIETDIVNVRFKEKKLVKEAINYSIKKINKILNKDEYILKYKIINKQNNENYITLNIFFSIIRNITSYKKIEEEIIE